MKAKILSVKGEKLREIELPKFFNDKIREDILVKVINSTRYFQPHAPFYQAGNQHTGMEFQEYQEKYSQETEQDSIGRLQQYQVREVVEGPITPQLNSFQIERK